MKRYDGSHIAVKLKVLSAKEKGRGLFYAGTESLDVGTVIGIYLGKIYHIKELIGAAASDYIMKFQFNGLFVIDAANFGNIIFNCNNIGNKLRFSNHSCDPNCEMIELNWKNEIVAMGLISTKTINPNDEITFKYNNDVSFKCFCDSDACKNRPLV